MYVGKEMILLPIALVVYLAFQGVMTFENMIYAIIGSLFLYVFVTMLGLHSGLSHAASRTATWSVWVPSFSCALELPFA